MPTSIFISLLAISLFACVQPSTPNEERSSGSEDASTPHAGAEDGSVSDADAEPEDEDAPFPLAYFAAQSATESALYVLLSDNPTEPVLVAGPGAQPVINGLFMMHGHWYQMDLKTADPLDFHKVSSASNVYFESLCDVPRYFGAMDGSRGGMLAYAIYDGRECTDYFIDLSMPESVAPVLLDSESAPAYVSDERGTPWGMARVQNGTVFFDSATGEGSFGLDRDDIETVQSVSHGLLAFLTDSGGVEFFSMSDRASVPVQGISTADALDDVGIVDPDHVVVLEGNQLFRANVRSGIATQIGTELATQWKALPMASPEQVTSLWSGDLSGWSQSHILVLSTQQDALLLEDVNLGSGDTQVVWAPEPETVHVLDAARTMSWATESYAFLTVGMGVPTPQARSVAVALDGSGEWDWEALWLGPVYEGDPTTKGNVVAATHILLWERTLEFPQPEPSRVLLLRNGDPEDVVVLGTLPPGVVSVQPSSNWGPNIVLNVNFVGDDGTSEQSDVFLLDVRSPESIVRITNTPQLTEFGVSRFH